MTMYVCRHRLSWSATLTHIFHLLSLLFIPSWIRLLTFTVSHFFIPSAGDVSQPYTSFLLWKVRGGVSIWVRQRSREAEGSRISSRRHVGLISRSWPLLSCRHVIAGPRLCWRAWIWGHVWVESLCGRFRPGQWQQCAPIMCMRLRAHADFTLTTVWVPAAGPGRIRSNWQKHWQRFACDYGSKKTSSICNVAVF